ncbi:MAG: aminotransferase class I/II-fold pyridoxal phosphate-dependent enzyme [Rubrivivax sp.]|nr:MAG: aminotransferase class I/II-fold pyridoxal phosphate-dependent enzyme [Rubrivivax sp.]
MTITLNEHGGPDAGPPIVHDFSTNANPGRAPDEVMAALRAADRHRYPDPHYQALRDELGRALGVQAERVLPTAGSSEAIRRLTLAAHLNGVKQVWVPQPGYGDYRAAAQALGLNVQAYASGEALLHGLSTQIGPALVWLCEPCNPTGQSLPSAFWTSLAQLQSQRGPQRLSLAVDRAYEPLRLVGEDPVPADLADQCWQLCSPNKALGLTGVRAGYMVAPQGETQALAALLALAPSWVLSAEGMALLQAWHQPATQAWLARSRQTLGLWMSAQQQALTRLGWHGEPSVVPFQLVRPAPVSVPNLLTTLRAQGIKLRDASSFGLPGWVRLSAQAPQAQQALIQALQEAGAVA